MGDFFRWAYPNKLKYGKSRLGESEIKLSALSGEGPVKKSPCIAGNIMFDFLC